MDKSTIAGSGKRIAYWDNAKGVLILLVVCGHLLQTLFSSEFGSAFLLAHDFIYLFHMPGFILISGYFLGKSKKNPLNRIPKFVLLWVLMISLYLCVNLLEGKGINLRLAKPQMGLWFLQFMIYAYIISFFCYAKKKPLALLVAIIISLFIGMDDTVGVDWSAGRAFYFMPFLIAGMCLNVEAILSFAKKHRSGCFLIVACSIIAANCCLQTDWINRALIYGKEGYESYGYSYPVGILLRAAQYCWSFVLTFAVLGLIPKSSSVITRIGKESLDIYLVHVFLLGAFYSKFEEACPLGLFGDVGIFSVLIVLACVAVVKLHHVLSGMAEAHKMRNLHTR